MQRRPATFPALFPLLGATYLTRGHPLIITVTSIKPSRQKGWKRTIDLGSLHTRSCPPPPLLRIPEFAGVYFANGQGGTVRGWTRSRGLELYSSDVGEDNHTPRNGQFIIAVSRSKGVDASRRSPHEPSRIESGMYGTGTGEGGRREVVALFRPHRTQRLSRLR